MKMVDAYHSSEPVHCIPSHVHDPFGLFIVEIFGLQNKIVSSWVIYAGHQLQLADEPSHSGVVAEAVLPSAFRVALSGPWRQYRTVVI